MRQNQNTDEIFTDRKLINGLKIKNAKTTFPKGLVAGHLANHFNARSPKERPDQIVNF